MMETVNTNQRLAIKPKDVFVSWTSADKRYKDAVIKYLEQRGIECFDSERDCQGDYVQWSREAVHAATVFILICTENVLSSKYVPMEVAEQKTLDGSANRILPVCESMAFYSRDDFGLCGYASAVTFEENGLDDEKLNEIFCKVSELIKNRMDALYREKTKSSYMHLPRLSGSLAVKEYDFTKLYVPRQITEQRGDETVVFDSPRELCNSDDIIFICGAAGSGKSMYIHQIRECADKDTVTITLPCHRFYESGMDLHEAMYSVFAKAIGDRVFYSAEDFKSMLANRHLLLVLDGLDEISTASATAKMLKKIDEYIKANGENTTLIFTSRNMHDADLIAIGGKNVRRFTLEKLTDEQICSLSENLFLLFDSKEKNQAFYLRVKDLTDEIKANPLLLSQLAMIYDEKGDIPQTVVGIYDAISEITLNFDKTVNITEVPDEYRTMVTREMRGILRNFSKKRYEQLAAGKNSQPKQIFKSVLKKYGDESEERAEFLIEHLENRAIMIDGEFYHKMFLEYFAAVGYFDEAFDLGEIEDADVIEKLFKNYTDPYWSAVIKLFLVKADSEIDADTTRELYKLILGFSIDEYTLLFESCRDLIKYKNEAAEELLSVMLEKSADGEYPAYGPLFWYVPQFEQYENLLLAAENLSGKACFAKALALIRDVCFMFGHKFLASDFVDCDYAKELFAAASANLSGVRKALCELFYLGESDFCGGDDIYPRCFNVAEAKSFMGIGQGVIGKMHTPFEDELGLFKHTSYNELCGEYIGFISCPYDGETEDNLIRKSTRKVSGIAFASTDKTNFEYLSFNYTNIKLAYPPENAIVAIKRSDYKYPLVHYALTYKDGSRVYHFGKVMLTRAEALGYQFGIEEIEVADGVTSIEKNAFSRIRGLKAVKIPDSVTEIGANAFRNCHLLEKAELPKGLKRIADNTFAGCSSLEKLSIPETVSEISEGAFSGCFGLSEIILPSNLETLGEGAFSCCGNLREIEIPSGVKEIPRDAFSFCRELKKVVLPDGLETVRERAFASCDSIEHITIPSSVMFIGEEAFAECDGISEIRLDSCIVGVNAFSHKTRVIRADCEWLYEDGGLLGKTLIPAYAYAGHDEITEIVIPESVTVIEEGAFSYCKNLTSVIMHDGITSIGEGAFKGCVKLENVKLPLALTVINEYTFDGCCSLTEMHIPENVEVIGEYAFGECVSLCDVTFSNGLEFIRETAFSSCDSLTRVLLPWGVDVAEDAFDVHTRVLHVYEQEQLEENIIVSGENNSVLEKMYAGNTALRSVKVLDGVVHIEELAFWECENLEKVELPDSLLSIETSAFNGCKRLAEINIPENCRVIESMAFSGCESLEKIEFPQCIKKIGGSAFSCCNALTEICISADLVDIGFGAFWKCANLKKAIIKGNIEKSEMEGVFQYCTSLETVELPDEVTQIGYGMFKECKSLKTISLPTKLQIIARHAFRFCTSLESITLPDGLSEIGGEAFDGCTSLKEITIPKSVRIIEDGAFDGCTALESVTVSRRFEGRIKQIFNGIDEKIIHFI